MLKGISLKILVAEVILFLLLIVGISYYFSPNDPFLLKTNVFYIYFIYLIPLIVFSLYYGFLAGFVYLILFIGSFTLFYKYFPTEIFLLSFLILLICSEFYYYWQEKTKRSEEKYKYIEEKLRDLAKEFMILKVSHDQLEKQYILKPVSIREIIIQIRQQMLEEKNINSVFQNLCSLLIHTFNIERAGFIRISVYEKKYETIFLTDDDFKIDVDDILIQKALEDKSITFLTYVEKSTKYFAVVPVFVNENKAYLFVIEKMDFLSLNLDNLLMISLFIFYIANEESFIIKNSKLISKYRDFSFEFLKENIRMAEIYENFGFNSSLVVIYVKNYSYKESFYYFIQKQIRGLDIRDEIYIKQKDLIIVPILLPFTPISGAYSFIKRFESEIVEHFSRSFLEKNLRINVREINENVEESLNYILDYEGFEK